jgi:hypothetical protein
MRMTAASWLLAACCAALPGPALADSYFLTVAGLGGEPDYEQAFQREAQDLEAILKGAGTTVHERTLFGPAATRGEVSAALAEIAAKARPEDDFILVLIGHGSHDGVEYKFNLPGPDMAAAEIAQACARIHTRRQLIVNTTSASGGAIGELTHAGRAVIAATKSGSEKNATVFARFFVEALGDPAADVNKDEAISALEAFQYATTKTAAYYDSQKRLATEHAVFDDQGGQGPPVREAATDGGAAGRLLASITLIRLGKESSAAASPERAKLLARKEALQQHIDTLKYQRAALSPDDYRQAMTDALLQLARVQQDLDKPPEKDKARETKPPDTDKAPPKDKPQEQDP